ncbi:hypothetical protein [Embleya sp. AB8]|uniref:hypothetical protein n=1 Tax=Embleya sp. AB8 TaxID=3156304 RepID=UPI003C73AF23
MGSGGADGGTGGPGRNGGQPGPSPFGPLELPRDETEALPRFDDYADQGPPQPYDPGHYPGPGQQPPYPGQQQHPYPGQQQHYAATQAFRQPPVPAPAPAYAPNPPGFAPPGAPGAPGAPGGVPPRPPHAPPGAVGSPMGAAPAAGPQPVGPADATQVFPAGLFRDEDGAPPPGQPMPPAHSAQPAATGGYPAPQPYAQQPSYGQSYAPPAGSPPPAAGPGGYADPGPGSGRSRTPLIAAGVGALVVVAAIGVFASGAFGNDDKSDPAANKGAAASNSSTKPDPAGGAAPQTAAPPPAKADDTAAQASAVDQLLQSGAGSRQAVSQAVQQIQKCEDPAAGAQALAAAAQQRDQQIAGLGKLTTDKLPSGADLVAGLREAWTASAESDRELAAWGTEMASGGCRDHRADYTDHKRAADRAGGRATTAKNKVVGLWNPIAGGNNLKKRSAGDF